MRLKGLQPSISAPQLCPVLSRQDTGSHCVFYHRYHIVWSTKYRYKVLTGCIRLRVRDICRQVCRERGVDIICGVLSVDHVHMFVSVPPKLAVRDLVRLLKGRSSHKVQRAFPQLKKRYWGRRFWGRGYFSPTNVPSRKTLYFSTWRSISQIPPAQARRWVIFWFSSMRRRCPSRQCPKRCQSGSSRM